MRKRIGKLDEKHVSATPRSERNGPAKDKGKSTPKSQRYNTETKGNASADQDAVKVTATGNYHGADEKATPYRKRVHSESSIKRGDGSNSEEEDDDASAASFSELFGAEGHQHLKHCFVISSGPRTLATPSKPCPSTITKTTTEPPHSPTMVLA